MPRRPHKYRASPTVVDGIGFASKAEAARYSTLKMLERANEIEDLELQPKFTVEVNGVHICDYFADFRYTDCREGLQVTEDVKGVKTPVYKLKKRLVEAVHGVTITEVPA